MNNTVFKWINYLYKYDFPFFNVYFDGGIVFSHGHDKRPTYSTKFRFILNPCKI